MQTWMQRRGGACRGLSHGASDGWHSDGLKRGLSGGVQKTRFFDGIATASRLFRFLVR